MPPALGADRLGDFARDLDLRLAGAGFERLGELADVEEHLRQIEAQRSEFALLLLEPGALGAQVYRRRLAVADLLDEDRRNPLFP